MVICRHLKREGHSAHRVHSVCCKQTANLTRWAPNLAVLMLLGAWAGVQISASETAPGHKPKWGRHGGRASTLWGSTAVVVAIPAPPNCSAVVIAALKRKSAKRVQTQTLFSPSR